MLSFKLSDYPTGQEKAALRYMLGFLEGDDKKNVLNFTYSFWQAIFLKKNEFTVSSCKSCTMAQANHMMKRIIKQGADSDWNTLAKAWVQCLRDEGFYYNFSSIKSEIEEDEGVSFICEPKVEAVIKDESEDVPEVKQEVMTPRKVKLQKREV
ncbi:hypothetical protein JHW43_005529 [Diplocarpon mali]|nr:hypothetical protein JHW43_005529 [Diplocarpon mali]